MSRRRLSPDEIELWRKVARTAEPMHLKPDTKPLSTQNKPPREKSQFLVETFEIGSRANHKTPVQKVLPGLPEQIARAPMQMDRKVFGKLKRGKLTPDAKIDLHGMTLDQANSALIRFIFKAQTAGNRLVLVITGKGKDRDDGGPIPVRMGVLRHNVPHWLAVPPLSQVVLQVTEAHLRHGGRGAYYVYLKRNR